MKRRRDVVRVRPPETCPVSPPTRLHSLFDLPVVLEEVAIGTAAPAELHPAEREVVAGAVAKRQAEFFAGRVAARRALTRLGGAALGADPLLPGPDRAPRWPVDVVGSITHSGDRCAVVVAWAREVAGLGLDLEPRELLDDELWGLVATPAERAALELLDEPQRGLLRRVSFSAKESVYKAVSARAGRVLEFQEVALTFEQGRFVASVPAELGFSCVRGRYQVDAAWVATGVALPVQPP